MSRFSLTKATRGASPLFFGLCGPSGGGKTFSALRLGTGIKSVVGGELAVIDTEAERARLYADRFDFLHMPFTAPFSPDDYWEAIADCISAGARTIVIDSMSHEHEGPGGVLEQHAAETQRLAKLWKTSEAQTQFPAWSEPKAKRRRLLNNILQVKVNLVLCFRAKKKVALSFRSKKKVSQAAQHEPISLGWLPIAGEEYAYEMTALGILPPGAKGVPDWSPLDPGSELVTKRPEYFEDILRPGEQLSEEMGAAMARWAQGQKKPPAQELGERALELITLINESMAAEELEELAQKIAADATAVPAVLQQHELAAIRNAYSKRRATFGPVERK